MKDEVEFGAKKRRLFRKVPFSSPPSSSSPSSSSSLLELCGKRKRKENRELVNMLKIALGSSYLKKRPFESAPPMLKKGGAMSTQ